MQLYLQKVCHEFSEDAPKFYLFGRLNVVSLRHKYFCVEKGEFYLWYAPYIGGITFGAGD